MSEQETSASINLDGKQPKPSQGCLRSLLPYAFAVILGTTALFLFRWGFVCPGFEADPDCFYHAKIVELGPSAFLARKFPALSQTTWAEHFSDKELGFHLILWLVTKVGAALGAENTFPFHYQVVFFDFLLLLAFNFLLWRQKFKHPWIYTLLLVNVLPIMTYRLLFLRAYLLSMAISTIVLAAFLEKGFYTNRRRWWFLLGIGILISWSYSSPHLILLTALPFALAEAAATRRWKPLLMTPACLLGGIVLGMTVHPQFPNTFLMFKIQCIDVVLAFFLNLEPMPIRGGQEFYVRTWHMAWVYGGGYYLPLVGSLIAWLVLRKRQGLPFQRQNFRLAGLLLLTVITYFASLFVFRVAEYALVPLVVFLAVLAAALDKSSEVPLLELPETSTAAPPLPWGTIGAAGMAIACLLLNCWQAINLPPQGFGNVPCYGIAQWAEKNKLPPGTAIANLSWGDFPMLYYAMPQYCYTYGIDPTFCWKQNPKALMCVAAMQMLPKDKMFTPEHFARLLHAQYLHIPCRYREIAEKLWECGFVQVYDDWDGIIFDLYHPARVITPNTPRLNNLQKAALQQNLQQEGR